MESSEGTSTGSSSFYKCTFVKKCEWVNTGTQEVMVFHPTMEEIADFPKLIRNIEKAGAHLSSGICKIVPPKEWSPRPSKKPGDYSDVNDFIIYQPVKESIEGSGGSFTRSIKVYRKKLSVGNFKKLATSKDYAFSKPDISLQELERFYWRSLPIGEPIYGADSPGTLYDSNVKEFNMSKLDTILDLLKKQRIKIAGVNTIFLYFGMWKTTFPWHVEDMDLYSINYLHFGEPKFWYAIPSQAAEKFERLACQQFPDGPQICKAFLRHKHYIISPTILKNHSIPYGTMVQYPNEIIITFPKGYHMGFNVGFNCAESTNFAIDRWIDYGKNAVLCYCRDDGVEIDMRPFMKMYRPDEFPEWFQYWYGERQSSIKEPNKLKNNEDPVLNTIYFERHRRLTQAKRSVKDLWCKTPVNLFAEKNYNSRRAKIFPHCAVCQYFLPRRVLLAESRASANKLQRSSRRFITDSLFYKENRRLASPPSDGSMHELVDDSLLECMNCYVVVHRRCYPVFDGLSSEQVCTSNNDDQLSPQPFFCVRCYKQDDITIRAASCALCELRGGALMEMVDDPMLGGGGSAGAEVTHFVHVICALIHQKTRFLEPHLRRAVYRPPPKILVPDDEDDDGKVVSGKLREGISFSASNGNRASFQISPINESDSGSDRPFSLSVQCSSGVSSPIQQTDGIHLSANPEEQSDDLALGSFSGGCSMGETVPVGRKKKSFSQQTFCYFQGAPPQRPSTSSATLSNEFMDQKSATVVLSSASSQQLPFSSCSSNDAKEAIRINNNNNSNRKVPTSVSSLRSSASASSLTTTEDKHCARYQCEVCGGLGLSEDLIRCKICLVSDDCNAAASLRYHITCAPLADIAFERRGIFANIKDDGAAVENDSRQYVIAVCSFHNSGHVLPKADPRNIMVGQRVIVSLTNNDVDGISSCSTPRTRQNSGKSSETDEEGCVARKGRVTNVWENLYCTVDFFDESVSNDLYPCDIRRCECHFFGCKGNHLSGCVVYVHWHDGKIYEAYYRGKAPVKKYAIQLLDGGGSDTSKRNNNGKGGVESGDAKLSFDDMEGERKPITEEESSENMKDCVEVMQDEIYTLSEPLPENIRNALLKRPRRDDSERRSTSPSKLWTKMDD